MARKQLTTTMPNKFCLYSVTAATFRGEELFLLKGDKTPSSDRLRIKPFMKPPLHTSGKLI